MILTARKRAHVENNRPGINEEDSAGQAVHEQNDAAADDDLQYKPDEAALKKSALSETFLFLGVIVCLALLITAINIYNVHQLERLKEQYGQGPDKQPDKGWWETGVVYHIYPRSFMDSDGDGIGDLNGIRQKVEYIKNLGVTSVLMAPFYPSPGVDFGADITDFKEVDSSLGTTEDFVKLVEELHKRGMKVLLDLVPNHTSDRHPWFHASRTGGSSGPYADYYVWHDGRVDAKGKRQPPSNWLSKYGGPAWTWDSTRQQYYLHQFHAAMPDLNYRNTKVRDELVETVRFWIDHGVDGFRLQDAHLLFESEDVALDEPDNELEKPKHDSSDVLEHIYTIDQPEIHEVTSTLHELVELQGSRLNKHIFLLVDAEGDTVKELMRYYFTGADAPMTLNLLKIDSSCGGKCVQEQVETWTEEMPDGKPVYWVISRPHHQRAVSRKGEKYGPAMCMLALTLPGTGIMMYGDELGLADLDITSTEISERLSSMPIMPWNGRNNAGFSSAQKTWLPLQEAYKTVNVELQLKDKTEKSPLHVFRKLTKLHQEPSFQYGKMQYAIVDDNIVSYIRYARDVQSYLVAVNIGRESSTDNYMENIGFAHGKVVVNTGNFDVQRRTAAGTIGSKIHLQNVTLQPGQGIIVKLEAETFYELPVL